MAAEDHPRIRGEHLRRASRRGGTGGSSPHTRGAPVKMAPDLRTSRIIPAYAGSTHQASSRRTTTEDHPRIRGEHRRMSSKRSSRQWIIPAYAGSTP